MRHDLLEEVRGIVATLEGVEPKCVAIVYGPQARVDILDPLGEPLKQRSIPLARMWSPSGGGTVERLSLEAGVAYSVQRTADRRVSDRETCVQQARAALARAEKELAAATTLRDRLAVIVDEDVAAARATRTHLGAP